MSVGAWPAGAVALAQLPPATQSQTSPASPAPPVSIPGWGLGRL